MGFSHGENLWTKEMEDVVKADERVGEVLIGGQGRTVPFLLAEVEDGVGVEELWELTERANQLCHERVRIQREKVVTAGKERPFVRLSKGSVDRRGTLREYEDVVGGVV